MVQNVEILRFAQNDKRESAQNDKKGMIRNDNYSVILRERSDRRIYLIFEILRPGCVGAQDDKKEGARMTNEEELAMTGEKGLQ